MTFYRIDTNRKGVRLEDLPDDAWTFISGGKDSDLGKLYSTVAWLYRCVDIRANAVASMPFELRRGENTIITFDGTSYDQMPERGLEWLIDLPELLAKTEAAAILGGAAYWERRQNIVGTRSVKFDWLLPSSINPKITEEGLQYFKRQLLSKEKRLEIDELVYFWMPDWMVELGPAKTYPGKAVMNNAGVIGSMDLFLQGYFERGMVKATLLKYKEAISADQRPIVKEWWKRVFSGVKNAHAAEVVRGDFETMNIGDGVSDLGDHALTDKERESIAAGLGVPQSKVAANAANFATKQSDDVMFIEDTVIPAVSWIHKTCNRQVFWPMGLNIVATPQKLRVMQHDETQRSQAFSNYVSNGLPIRAAIEMLGLDIPEELLVEMDAAPEPEPEPMPIQLQEAQRSIGDIMRAEEVGRLQRWAEKRQEADPDEFASDILTRQEIRGVVEAVKTGRPFMIPDNPMESLFVDALRRFDDAIGE